MCSSRIYGVRFVCLIPHVAWNVLTNAQKCIECPDFDVCEPCQAITNEQHPNHSFIKISKLNDIVYRQSRRNLAKHRAMCDAPGCSKTIHGVRYKCMHPSCKDFDLCADCEALPIPVHPIDHPLLKIKTPKTIIPRILREGQEIREKTEPVIPALPVERNFPLPQIPVLQPLPVHAGTIGVPVMPPRPPLPAPVPIRINSFAQTVEAPRVSSSTQTFRRRRNFAALHTANHGDINHGEEKGVQVEAPTPVPARRIIRIPIVEEVPKREPESPKIIVLPSVPTTEPVDHNGFNGSAPIPPRPDPVSLTSPDAYLQGEPTVVKVLSPPTPVAVPSPIAVRPPSPSVTTQTPSPVPATPLVVSEPEMTQTITRPASLYSNFIASRPALEPIALSAAFVEDMNVADGTTFPPGAEFIKCWKMINDGRHDWPTETILVFVGGHRLAAFVNAPNSYDVGKAAVSQAVDVWAGDLKAPEEPGVYNSFWRLRNGENGEFFGHRVSFVHQY
jgi:next-to-BRCA1 protein 1